MLIMFVTPYMLLLFQALSTKGWQGSSLPDRNSRGKTSDAEDFHGKTPFLGVPIVSFQTKEVLSREPIDMLLETR
jgi:hypothetical protein